MSKIIIFGDPKVFNFECQNVTYNFFTFICIFALLHASGGKDRAKRPTRHLRITPLPKRPPKTG